MSFVSYVKENVNSLSVSEETKQTINNTVDKVATFVKENKSLVFFGLTVLFSYWVSTFAAYEYCYCCYYCEPSLIESFVEGAVFASIIGIAKNIFSSKVLTEKQDDNINYLAGLFNLGVTFLSPSEGVYSAVNAAGSIAVKNILNKLALMKDKDVSASDAVPVKA